MAVEKRHDLTTWQRSPEILRRKQSHSLNFPRLLMTAFVTLILWLSPLQAQKADDAEVNALISTGGPTFRVPPGELQKHWTIIAYGDMRFTDPANQEVTNPKVRRWLVDRIAQEHPDALLLSGDVPYNGAVTNDYDVYRQETAVWRSEGLRVYPAIGNHELHGDEIREPNNWWRAFPELRLRRWYSVALGNAFVITLDSNLLLSPTSRQGAWLSDQLGHIPEDTQFIFISLHHPPVADSIAGNHSHDVRNNERGLAALLENCAPRLKAKIIVVAGHIHNYQRFYENGVVYLVSGGGGARPYPIARTPADLFQDNSFPNYHYLKFVFDGTSLQATMYRVKDPSAATPSWEIKDAFAISPMK
jgi:3',5'-cyclic AMP phosphodiesterase CpdA